MKKTRITALILSVLLLLPSLCGCVPADELLARALYEAIRTTSAGQPEEDADVYELLDRRLAEEEKERKLHEPVVFSDLTPSMPDMDRVLDAIRAIEREDGDVFAILDRIDAADTLLDEAATDYSLYELNSYLDVHDEESEKNAQTLYDQLNDADRRYTDAICALLEGPHREELEYYWGEDYVEAMFLDQKLNSDEIADLQSREKVLSDAYDRIYNETTVEYGGKTMTLDEAFGDDTLDYYAYFDLYEAACRALCENTADTFIELVNVRNEIADTLGYDSFAEYQYLCYDRDYTPEDALEFEKSVKEEIVPRYIYWYSNDYTSDMRKFYSREWDQEQSFAMLGSVVRDIAPEIGDAYGYMCECGLYDIDPDPEKAPVNFTTFLEAYKAPFLFTSFEGNAYSVSTLFHELGHFSSYYNNPGDGPLDLAEIDSQGLEMLSMAYYDRIYDEKLAGAAAADKLEDMLYAMTTGCEEDEFQQRVYALAQEKELTLEDICRIEDEINEEYRAAELHPCNSYEWALIPHTFQDPFYYISYAVSAVPAVEIWYTAAEDFDAGRELYLSLYTRDHSEDFSDVLEELGFRDPLDGETVTFLGDAIHAEMKRALSRSWTFTH